MCVFCMYWMVEEFGFDYELVLLCVCGFEICDVDYFEVNLNVWILVIVDGGFVFWELMVINIYLVFRYGEEGGFWLFLFED